MNFRHGSDVLSKRRPYCHILIVCLWDDSVPIRLIRTVDTLHYYLVLGESNRSIPKCATGIEYGVDP